MKLVGDLDKKNVFLDTIYIVFFKKKNLLRMRIAENKYCIEKYDCVKKMTSCHFKWVGFYCEEK